MNRMTAPEAKVLASPQLPIVLMDTVRIPPLSDQEAFRRWARSPEFPERGRFSYLNGELWVDLSMEQLFSHNRVKPKFAAVLDGFVDAEELGYYFSDGTLISHPAGLSTEPDGVFVSSQALETQRVRLVEGTEEGYVELEGTPDMVLEVVSRYSVRKDTEVLRDLYWRAGISEYWLVDARGSALRFDMLRRGAKRYVATRTQNGWLRSVVFSRSFRLTQKLDSRGHPRYKLEVQP
jgi:Uma2 family endonuclease